MSLTVYFQHGVLTVQEVSVLSLGNFTCLHHKKFEFGLEVKTKNDTMLNVARTWENPSGSTPRM